MIVASYPLVHPHVRASQTWSLGNNNNESLEDFISACSSLRASLAISSLSSNQSQYLDVASRPVSLCSEEEFTLALSYCNATYDGTPMADIDPQLSVDHDAGEDNSLVTGATSHNSENGHPSLMRVGPSIFPTMSAFKFLNAPSSPQKEKRRSWLLFHRTGDSSSGDRISSHRISSSMESQDGGDSGGDKSKKRRHGITDRHDQESILRRQIAKSARTGFISGTQEYKKYKTFIRDEGHTTAEDADEESTEDSS